MIDPTTIHPLIDPTTIHPYALDLFGIPFEKGGRTREGADCLGVVFLFLDALKIPYVDPWTPEQTAQWCGAEPTEVPPNDAAPFQPDGVAGSWRSVELGEAPLPGDVLVSERERHVAVYVGGGWVLQAAANSRSGLRDVRRVPVLTRWRYES